MEVDKTAFAPRLLEILEELGQSHFVSLDLELSGVSSKTGSAKKQTLQERYEQTKEAAEKYTILQVGITCVQQDLVNDTYVVRPYNFPLSPLFTEKLDVERTFAFSNGSAEFLLSHGFKIDRPFTHGVPYLSRNEAVLAKKVAMERMDKSNYQPLQLADTDKESLKFIRNVQAAINSWKKKDKTGQLTISSSDPLAPQPAAAAGGLSSFERRLVHQLVRAEYPDLISITKVNSIIIKPFDQERENAFQATRKRRITEQITRQVGFRWIVEAMAGGKIGDIDIRTFARDPATGFPVYADSIVLQTRLLRAKDAIRAKRPVLVGHNLFTDLVYFYQTFLGDLPPTVTEFQKVIHDLFPVVVDTKYMVTHNCGDINPASSLDQVELALRGQIRPVIQTHPEHTKYLSNEAFHEAGYDSYLTALVVIRLSAKLEDEGTYMNDVAEATEDSDQESYYTAPEDESDGGVALIDIGVDDSSQDIAITQPVFDTEAGSSLAALEPGKKKRRSRSGKKRPQPTPEDEEDTQKSRFSHRTVFDELRNLGMDGAGDDEDMEELGNFSQLGSPSYDKALSIRVHPPQDEKPPMTLMPPFGTKFWRVYGNKLRVFGTKENVLHLTG